MKKMVGAMALGVVLAAGSVTAAEAAPKSFTVTAKVSKSSSSVGAKVKVSGKVTGQSAKALKGQKVTVQRKYATGGWKKVGTAKITSKRTYSLSVKLTAGGNTSFRAIKAKSGKIKSGTSATRTLSVFKWIDLTSAPQFSYSIGIRNSAVTMQGKRYAKALQGISGTFAAFNVAGKCKTLTTYTGFLDREKSQLTSAAQQELQVQTFNTPTGSPTSAGTFVTSLNTVAKRTANIAGTVYVAVQAQTNEGTAVLALPQVYCNLDSLPTLPDDFFSGMP